ncbi:phospho-sugar mutase [Companilactobacillus huachuanensis]|uniref:Phosphoglucomutase n=1 Tax=Companilactobacillus huachuanensis TaxID=2559914 RepID=A0ABW1RQH2_9LACO|nr:phospho-sugar mutase [Companilactobacillus huachuanensis]
MNWQDNFQMWENNQKLDSNIKNELNKINDNEELKDRFSAFPTFGTGGIRAKLGVGTSRLNYYTVARTTEGLANYILKNKRENEGVVISFDTRNYSNDFAIISANILAQNGIKVYICNHVTPTPELSYLVRHFEAGQGIMITASHNPAIYNGYKVYDSDGGQITLDTANEISVEIDKCRNYLELSVNTKLTDSPLVNILDEDVENLYLHHLKEVTRNPKMIEKYGNELKIVYTPLHGTGLKLVTKGLEAAGFTNVIVEPQQAIPDPNFSTVKFPNPEFPSAFDLAIKLGYKEDADILIATDPDADRLGVALRDENGIFRLLSGNQLGALMVNYLVNHISQNDHSRYQVVKTIVTSNLGAEIAKKNNCDVRETLTGFKFIGEQIEEIEESADDIKYLFAYEESYGYLISPFVRDKDSIQAALLTAEIALSLKRHGENLLTQLESLYSEFGFYQDKLITKTFTSEAEANTLVGKIAELRNSHPKTIGNMVVQKIQDFEKSEQFDILNDSVQVLKLPKSNVIKIILKDQSWLAIRPSGTEPKIKIYISCVGNAKKDCQNKLSVLENFANKLLEV